jgi:hypothetical protein
MPRCLLRHRTIEASGRILSQYGNNDDGGHSRQPSKSKGVVVRGQDEGKNEKRWDVRK